jgi:fermentation-respiration switch protein FrsA (DUF1100 family)
LRHLEDHRFPILVIHGDRDRTIPFEQGQALFDQLAEPKDFHCVAGAGHIDIHMLDSSSYMRRILKFVEDSKPPVVH